MANREAREGILQQKQIRKLFCTYTIERDGVAVGSVRLDENHARDHIHQCLNSMKKFGTYMCSKNEEPNCKDEESAATVACISKEETFPEGSSTKKRRREDTQSENNQSTKSKKLKVQTDADTDDSDEDTSISELEKTRARNIEENRMFMIKEGLVPLAEKDVLTVAKAWFPPDAVAKLNVGRVLAEIEKLGFTKPKRSTLTKCLVHFGKELVQNKLVELTKSTNLVRSDIKI